MLRSLDGGDLVAQIHGLSALRRLAAPRTQLCGRESRNFASMGQDGCVNGIAGTPGGQLRV
ncbi:MAG TPA: hypothetical protein VJ299_11680, partial [Steroidobacteraceae bacterium]|nr:hypothetical protein [Steroidobacteraceae bacterium]